jgi:hypothetical protein
VAPCGSHCAHARARAQCLQFASVQCSARSNGSPGKLGTIPALRQRTLRTQSASICPRLSRLIATSAETMSSQEHLAQCLGPVVRCGRLHAVRTRKRPNDCKVRAHDLRRKGRRSERKVRHSFKRSTGFCGSDPSMAFSIVFRSDTTNLNRTPLSQPVVRFL